MAKAYDTSILGSSGSKDTENEILAALHQQKNEGKTILEYPIKSVLFPLLFYPVEQIYRFLSKRGEQVPCVPCTKSDGRILIIRASEIAFVCSTPCGAYVTDIRGEKHFTNLSLKAIKERASLFCCHRQFLVNLSYISEIHPLKRGVAKIKVAPNTLIPVSRGSFSALKERLAL